MTATVDSAPREPSHFTVYGTYFHTKKKKKYLSTLRFQVTSTGCESPTQPRGTPRTGPPAGPRGTQCLHPGALIAPWNASDEMGGSAVAALGMGCSPKPGAAASFGKSGLEAGRLKEDLSIKN